ncbi:MAG: hypothetical protein E7502_08275 [Ruminococcus sp.]|nr:hypothetical protein [Ruminococcus sp.]
MKHRFFCAFTMALMLAAAPAAHAAEGLYTVPICEMTLAAASYDSESVYNAMIALQDKYPTGMTWTNDNYYAWNGGIYGGGYGCTGFAFMLSDAAFGTLPAKKSETFDAASVRVGDIVRYSSHSVIVLEVKANSVIVAEGNINSMIYWGREISFDEIRGSFESIITRYPQGNSHEHFGDPNCDDRTDAADAAIILQAAAEVGANGTSGMTEEQEGYMDVDLDEDFDAADAALVLIYAAYNGSGGTMSAHEYLTTLN